MNTIGVRNQYSARFGYFGGTVVHITDVDHCGYITSHQVRWIPITTILKEGSYLSLKKQPHFSVGKALSVGKLFAPGVVSPSLEL